MNAAPTVASLQNRSRTELAHARLGKAVERTDSLGMELRSAFTELDGAIADMNRVGVETNVKMPFPLNEAWADWRAKQILKT